MAKKSFDSDSILQNMLSGTAVFDEDEILASRTPAALTEAKASQEPASHKEAAAFSESKEPSEGKAAGKNLVKRTYYLDKQVVSALRRKVYESENTSASAIVEAALRAYLGIREE